MGVAGAAGDQGRFILLAGIAGLLAGAFSMAAGEYISMQSQRELFERQIALERAELEAMPEEEEAEMAALYRAKGFRGDEAEAIAHRLFEDPERALDKLVREELGLDPDELGSPFGRGGRVVRRLRARGVRAGRCRTSSASGAGAFVAAIALSLVALFAVGAGRQPADRPRRPVLRRAPGRDRGGGGRRDVRSSAYRRHRRGGRLTWAELADRLRAEGLEPGRWSNGPGDRYGAHDHGYDKVIVVESGSICSGCRPMAIRGARGRRSARAAGGDDATTRSSGPAASTCLEAHRRRDAGSAAAPRRRGLVTRNRQAPAGAGASWVRLSRRDSAGAEAHPESAGRLEGRSWRGSSLPSRMLRS